MDGTNKNFHVIVKSVHTSDGKKSTVEFIVWHEISINIYDKTVFRVLF